jgi:hypothetical protein
MFCCVFTRHSYLLHSTVQAPAVTSSGERKQYKDSFVSKDNGSVWGRSSSISCCKLNWPGSSAYWEAENNGDVERHQLSTIDLLGQYVVCASISL